MSVKTSSWFTDERLKWGSTAKMVQYHNDYMGPVYDVLHRSLRRGIIVRGYLLIESATFDLDTIRRSR